VFANLIAFFVSNSLKAQIMWGRNLNVGFLLIASHRERE
jgi:hypothetical protein